MPSPTDQPVSDNPYTDVEDEEEDPVSTDVREEQEEDAVSTGVEEEEENLRKREDTSCARQRKRERKRRVQ